MELILIRHGESVANIKNLVCGRLDYDLSEKGIEQAKSLKESFSDINFEKYKILSSPLRRARHTAEIIFSNRASISEELLTELDTGILSELSYDDLYKLHPEYQFIGENDIAFPEGESVKDMFNRIKILFQKYDFRVVSHIIVSHSGVINAILHLLLDISIVQFPSFKIKNCAITILKYDNQVKKWRLEGMNCYEK